MYRRKVGLVTGKNLFEFEKYLDAGILVSLVYLTV